MEQGATLKQHRRRKWRVGGVHIEGRYKGGQVEYPLTKGRQVEYSITKGRAGSRKDQLQRADRLREGSEHKRAGRLKKGQRACRLNTQSQRNGRLNIQSQRPCRLKEGLLTKGGQVKGRTDRTKTDQRTGRLNT